LRHGGVPALELAPREQVPLLERQHAVRNVPGWIQHSHQAQGTINPPLRKGNLAGGWRGAAPPPRIPRFRLSQRERMGYTSGMAMPTKAFKLPEHFDVERELLEQFSNRPGHQRCVEGRDELLLVLHEVPQPGVPEREPLYFWKRHDGRWVGPSGPGLADLGDLLDRYAQAIDGHEEVIDEADTAAEIFAILRHSGPLARSTRNLVQALEQALAADHDNREVRSCRDRARELERAADLLHADARVTLEFWQAERAEEHSRSSARLGRIAFRMNLLAGFFMPLMALSGLFGMNVAIPGFAQPLFWGILLVGIGIGGALLVLVGRQTGRRADFEGELGDDNEQK
jgi:hypothetical protein